MAQTFAQVMIELETAVLAKPFTYLAPYWIEPGCRVLVPFGRQKLCGLVIECLRENPDPSIEYKEIEEVIDERPVLNEKQMKLAVLLADWSIASTMSLVHAMLPKSLDARASRARMAMEWIIRKKTPDEPLRPRQQEALNRLEDGMLLKDARQAASAYMISALEKAGAIEKEQRPILHGSLPKNEPCPWPELNDDQKKALDVLSKAKTPVSLLHGVTGSGKTEVFFHLAAQTLSDGKQVLILVPEISLTPMMEQRLTSRFDVPVFSCHSRLSDSQMLSIWNSVPSAGPCIVIGTRKSIFLPFSDLGLVIMDEEHDASYKQDTYPRYHAREAAQIFCHLHQCPLVLASATPSLESFARALKGVYTLAELPHRAAGQDARVSLVDLRCEQTWSAFSSSLIEAMMKNLQARHKTLLLLNRRGYLPTVRCKACHEYLVCEDCGVPLSYHKNEDAMVCHICGRRYVRPRLCPSCGQPALSNDGQGTERLEENTRSLFPDARIVRMDHDTTRKKGAHAQLLAEFETDGDILLGTQMISKGLDFHDVTLGAILSIDSLLARPDYLSSEKAYQLIEQTAGRAGRGHLPGRVLIQTYNPNHFVLGHVVRHSYRGFFQEEMRYRHAGLYPPYSFVGTVIISGKDRLKTYNKMQQILEQFEPESDCVLGPVEISMRKGQPRWRLIFKERSDTKLRDLLWRVSDWFGRNGRGFRLDLNRNPSSLEE